MISSPYKGKLVDLMVKNEDEKRRLFEKAVSLPKVPLLGRSLYDFALLVKGAFSPLERFMGKEDYESVLQSMRLKDGTLFPIPVNLPLRSLDGISLDSEVALVGRKNEILAVMRVEEIYEYDKNEECKMVYGTLDFRHPMVLEMGFRGRYYISGELKALSLPIDFYVFSGLPLYPDETRRALEAKNPQKVIAFQTRNPLHRGHEEVIKRALSREGRMLLFHPSVGMTNFGDVDSFVRIRTYEVLLEKYFRNYDYLFGLLPLAMRLAGPREALWHGIIRRNYGATHFIVGRDHASPGFDSKGKPFYDPYEAQELFKKHEEEIGIKGVYSKELVYLPDEDRYCEIDEVPDGKKYYTVSGKTLRGEYLSKGRIPPEWMMRKEVAQVIIDSQRRKLKGFCIWITGLPASGKSTLLEALRYLFLREGIYVTAFDGDETRRWISNDLGFSREDRMENIRRASVLAGEIVRHGGIAICAYVSPYNSARELARSIIGRDRFVLVYVNTPLDVCISRDIKGFYKRALKGEIKNMTGVGDIFEEPQDADFKVQMTGSDYMEGAKEIFDYVMRRFRIEE